MKSEEEILDALKVIKEVCKDSEDCYACPLRDAFDSCKLKSECFPSDWRLKEPKDRKYPDMLIIG